MAKRKKNGSLTPEKVLDTTDFTEFSNNLNKLTEQQLEKALEIELADRGRTSYIERIRQRHASKREAREKRELKERIGA
jgi:hypothetical protein